MENVAVLLTCFNRKEKTLLCLKWLYDAIRFYPEVNYDIHLVDDGSSDGTAEAVQSEYSGINIIRGSGKLFWAGGMRLAWETAIKVKTYDYFLLLNDDTLLLQNAMESLFASNKRSYAKFSSQGIIIGTTKDQQTGKLTYGGKKLKNKNFLTNYMVYDDKEDVPCDLGNANIMLVSSAVVNKIGILSTGFAHGVADFDYTLRAKKEGFFVVVSAGILGFCKNDHEVLWESGPVSLKKRIAFLYSPKGFALKYYSYFVWKHFPLDFPGLFVKLWFRALFPSMYNWLKKR